ncbi:HNH endonuclease [Maritalea mobilis]|uniref:HNH endonuclease n=1 Tax=Maritalea mobilis TaxID=483324 RepID=A0A4R6VN74_9HYPH|nr:HNH endonuclease signature motif containing protein [Maritalea mobilis]TDQ63623.1 HNH endonuclease [Maritalea mobilis]
MKGRSIPYSKEELVWLEARKTKPRRQLHTEFVQTFGRDDITLANFKAKCTRMGWKTGRTGQFKKGITPHNKGKPHPPKGRAKETQFKKGNTPHNTNYLGHERQTKNGYIEISVDEVNPHTGYERRYVLKHRWMWEKANGPVPEGHALKCLDGDKTNCDPSNWEAIPRALLPRLSGAKKGINYDQAPAELKPTILTVAKLEHASREANQ